MARKSSTHPFSYDNRPPRIACFNRAKTPMGVDLDALIAAMQKFVDDHLAPVWGTPGTLIKSRGFLKGAWAMAFLDSEDDASLEGYHDLTPEGLPMSKVFVRNILKQKDQVSVAASHELAEMLVDPAANLYSTGPKSNRLYDYEVADPGRGTVLPGRWHCHDRLRLSGILRDLPQARINSFRPHGALDLPFALHLGGYQSYFSGGKEDSLGFEAKEVRFKNEDRRGHRSEFRHKVERRLSKGPLRER